MSKSHRMKQANAAFSGGTGKGDNSDWHLQQQQRELDAAIEAREIVGKIMGGADHKSFDSPKPLPEKTNTVGYAGAIGEAVYNAYSKLPAIPRTVLRVGTAALLFGTATGAEVSGEKLPSERDLSLANPNANNLQPPPLPLSRVFQEQAQQVTTYPVRGGYVETDSTSAGTVAIRSYLATRHPDWQVSQPTAQLASALADSLINKNVDLLGKNVTLYQFTVNSQSPQGKAYIEKYGTNECVFLVPQNCSATDCVVMNSAGQAGTLDSEFAKAALTCAKAAWTKTKTPNGSPSIQLTFSHSQNQNSQSVTVSTRLISVSPDGTVSVSPSPSPTDDASPSPSPTDEVSPSPSSSNDPSQSGTRSQTQTWRTRMLVTRSSVTPSFSSSALSTGSGTPSGSRSNPSSSAGRTNTESLSSILGEGGGAGLEGWKIAAIAIGALAAIAVATVVATCVICGKGRCGCRGVNNAGQGQRAVIMAPPPRVVVVPQQPGDGAINGGVPPTAPSFVARAAITHEPFAGNAQLSPVDSDVEERGRGGVWLEEIVQMANNRGRGRGGI